MNISDPSRNGSVIYLAVQTTDFKIYGLRVTDYEINLNPRHGTFFIYKNYCDGVIFKIKRSRDCKSKNSEYLAINKGGFYLTKKREHALWIDSTFETVENGNIIYKISDLNKDLLCALKKYNITHLIISPVSGTTTEEITSEVNYSGIIVDRLQNTGQVVNQQIAGGFGLSSNAIGLSSNAAVGLSSNASIGLSSNAVGNIGLSSNTASGSIGANYQGPTGFNVSTGTTANSNLGLNQGTVGANVIAGTTIGPNACSAVNSTNLSASANSYSNRTIQQQVTSTGNPVVVPATNSQTVNNLNQRNQQICNETNGVWVSDNTGSNCITCTVGSEYADQNSGICRPCPPDATCGEHGVCYGKTNPSNARCTLFNNKYVTSCNGVNDCGGSCSGYCPGVIFGWTCVNNGNGTYSCKFKDWWKLILWIVFIALLVLLLVYVIRLLTRPKKAAALALAPKKEGIELETVPERGVVEIVQTGPQCEYISPGVRSVTTTGTSNVIPVKSNIVLL